MPVQEVDSDRSDLSPNEQVVTVLVVFADLFNKECSSAEPFLALKSDPVQKASIKCKLGVYIVSIVTVILNN